MTPLDDELRQALASRAALVAPSPDPLAGIAARAGRIRRRRAALAASGAALAVAAVALVVPQLGVGRTSTLRPAASASPAESAAATAAPPENALLPTADASGERVVPGTDPVVDAWAAAHPGSGDVYRLGLVSGRTGSLTYELLELWRSGGPAYAVGAQDVGSRPVLVRDAEVAPGAAFLDAVVSGPDAGPLVLFALAQGVVSIAYDPGDGRLPRPAAFREGDANSGVFDRTGPAAGRPDTLTATYSDGRTSTEPVWSGGASGSTAPANVLDWVARGTGADGPAASAVAAAYAQQRGSSPEKATYRALYTGSKGSLRFTVGQVWLTGDAEATTVTYSEGSPSGTHLFEHGAAGADAAIVAGWTPDADGKELLVLVPRPGVGQVLYSATATGAFQPVANGRSDLEGVALVDRASGNTQDRVEVLDGDGNLDHPLYEGPVAALLLLPVS